MGNVSSGGMGDISTEWGTYSPSNDYSSGYSSGGDSGFTVGGVPTYSCLDAGGRADLGTRSSSASYRTRHCDESAYVATSSGRAGLGTRPLDQYNGSRPETTSANIASNGRAQLGTRDCDFLGKSGEAKSFYTQNKEMIDEVGRKVIETMNNGRTPLGGNTRDIALGFPLPIPPDLIIPHPHPPIQRPDPGPVICKDFPKCTFA